MLFLPAVCLFLCACSVSGDSAEPFDGSVYIKESTYTGKTEAETAYDPDGFLSVPTCLILNNGYYFIDDCYHNRIIFSDDIKRPLGEWRILTADVSQSHTLASDGDIILADDTENNRVLVFERGDNGDYVNTQLFENIGIRPHYTVYDKRTDTFYTLSSMTGELYCFRCSKNKVYLTEIRSVPELYGTYVRSFMIADDEIYFVSGISTTGFTPQILRCSLNDLKILEAYEVPSGIAGMVQITPLDTGFYITVSTDAFGDTKKAELFYTPSLKALSNGEYTPLYHEYFAKDGTPYYITRLEKDGVYYLLSHRSAGTCLFSFEIENNVPVNIEELH